MSDAFGRTVQWNNGQGVVYQAVYGPQGQKFAFMEGTTLVRYYDPMVAGMMTVHNGPAGSPANSGLNCDPTVCQPGRYDYGIHVESGPGGTLIVHDDTVSPYTSSIFFF
jgi:hypothetical protein